MEMIGLILSLPEKRNFSNNICTSKCIGVCLAYMLCDCIMYALPLCICLILYNLYIWHATRLGQTFSQLDVY